MKARYENDKAKGPGHGFLQLTDLAEDASFEGVTVSIKRASDQKWLSRGDWHSAEHFLPVQGISLTDDGVALAVGPEIVDGLDTVETFRLTLAFANGVSASSMLAVPEVAYSPLPDGAVIGGTPQDPPKSEPEAKSELKSEPETEQETKPETEPEPEEEPQELPAPPLLPPQRKKKSSGLPVAVLILLLLLAGGFALWRFEPAPQDAPQAEANATSPAPSPLDRARAHLSGQADPVAGLAMAKELLTRPEGADAAFLLVEDAAQKGLPEAMLLAGAFYDPADNSAHGSIEADPELALIWYKSAGEKGEEAVKKRAEEKIADLKAWAEAEAAKGNVGAKDLLDRL